MGVNSFANISDALDANLLGELAESYGAFDNKLEELNQNYLDNVQEQAQLRATTMRGTLEEVQQYIGGLTEEKDFTKEEVLGSATDEQLNGIITAYSTEELLVKSLIEEYKMLAKVFENNKEKQKEYTQGITDMEAELRNISKQQFSLNKEAWDRDIKAIELDIKNLGDSYDALEQRLNSKTYSSATQEELLNNMIMLDMNEINKQQLLAIQNQAAADAIKADFADGLFEGEEVGEDDYKTNGAW